MVWLLGLQLTGPGSLDATSLCHPVSSHLGRGLPDGQTQTRHCEVLNSIPPVAGNHVEVVVLLVGIGLKWSGCLRVLGSSGLAAWESCCSSTVVHGYWAEVVWLLGSRAEVVLLMGIGLK